MAEAAKLPVASFPARSMKSRRLWGYSEAFRCSIARLPITISLPGPRLGVMRQATLETHHARPGFEISLRENRGYVPLRDFADGNPRDLFHGLDVHHRNVVRGCAGHVSRLAVGRDRHPVGGFSHFG